jgi:hypothetical protein
MWIPAGKLQLAFVTNSRHRLVNPALSVRHCTDASTLAGELILGSLNMLMTDIKIVATLWVGNQRSSGSYTNRISTSSIPTNGADIVQQIREALVQTSPLMASSPGGCKILIHTRPSGYTTTSHKPQATSHKPQATSHKQSEAAH